MVKFHVFDVDRLPRRVWDRSWPILAAKSAQNDPNLAPQNDPKSTPNRCPKTIEILIENKGGRGVFLGRPGGMRWPPGGIIGGAKNSLFEICRCLRHIKALRFGDLAFGLDIWLSVWHARLRPSGAGGGLIDFPKGDHRRPPAFCRLRFGAWSFCFIDLCEFGDLSVFGACWSLLGPLDRRLGSLEALLEPPGALLAASWNLFGRSCGGLGVSWAPLGSS